MGKAADVDHALAHHLPSRYGSARPADRPVTGAVDDEHTSCGIRTTREARGTCNERAAHTAAQPIACLPCRPPSAGITRAAHPVYEYDATTTRIAGHGHILQADCFVGGAEQSRRDGCCWHVCR